MKFLLLCLSLFLSESVLSQTISITIKNQDGHGIPNASISLINLGSKTTLQQGKSDSLGKFQFPISKIDSIEIQVSHLLYQSYGEKLAVKDIKSELSIELKPLTQEIEEVKVTGKRPQVYRKIDRLVFDVANSNISSLNGWDILKRTPLVNIQGSSLSIRGSQSIVVLINEKRQLMSMDELKNLLESTTGTEIQSIEVITNPPAKYEASGTAVINIKMKQVTDLGYKGSLYTKYEQSNYAKQLFGINQNYKNEKFNIRTGYYFGRGTYARYGTDVVNYPKDQTRWESTLTRIDQNKNQQTYNVNAEYNPDSTLTLNLGFDGSYQPKSNGIYIVPTLIYNNQGIQESHYLTNNDHNRYSKRNNIYFQLTKKRSDNFKLDWTNYYSSSIRKQFQDINTSLNFKDQPSQTSQFITNDGYQTILASSQLDLMTKIKSIEFEFGGKYSYVKSENWMDFKDDSSGELEIRPEKSSNFDYQEQNTALYLSSSYNLKKWQFKAGLRAEYTDLEGKVSIPQEINKSDYLTLFPTFYLQYQTDNNAQYSFSYGKRINRPSYSWLNPAKSYYNQFSYFQGDPNLRATISHNLNLGFNHKNWIVDLFYNYEKWPNMEISYQNNETNELIYHYTNIEHGQAAGISLNKSLELTSFWSLYMDLTGLYQDNYFIGVDQKVYKNDIYSLNSLARTTFTLNKPSDWNLELSHQYFSPSIQGTFNISHFSSTDLIMNRKFLNKKLELSLYFLDIFKTQGTKISTKYADQDNYFLDYQDSRKLVFTLRFNFGNQRIKNGKNIQSTDEQKRI